MSWRVDDRYGEAMNHAPVDLLIRELCHKAVSLSIMRVAWRSAARRDAITMASACKAYQGEGVCCAKAMAAYGNLSGISASPNRVMKRRHARARVRFVVARAAGQRYMVVHDNRSAMPGASISSLALVALGWRKLQHNIRNGK